MSRVCIAENAEGELWPRQPRHDGSGRGSHAALAWRYFSFDAQLHLPAESILCCNEMFSVGAPFPCVCRTGLSQMIRCYSRSFWASLPNCGRRAEIYADRPHSS